MNDRTPVSGVRQDLSRTVLAVLLILALTFTSFWVLRPFLLAAIWAMMIVVATWPLMLDVQARLRRRGLAIAVMTLAMLVIFIAPLFFTIQTLVENADRITGWLRALLAADLPPPPDWLQRVPLVGSRLAERWAEAAATGKEGIAASLTPYATAAAQWLAGMAGSLGTLVLHFLLTVILAAILYARGEPAREALLRFGRRLAGPHGETVVVLAGKAIRAVALGVVVTALVQTLLAGVGLALAGIPFAGILSAVILLLCIAQLGPVLVLAPAVIWLFWTDRTGWGTALLVWTILIGVLDNVLRPLLIRRGADLPLLLIFAGVIGGLLSFGVIGLFVGPVVLAIAFTLLTEWMNDRGPVAAPRTTVVADDARSSDARRI